MKILIVDDHVLFREGLSSLIAKQTDLTVVGEAGSVHEAIEKARTTLPEMILLDFNLPDGTGLDATRAILAELPDVKIVFLTIYEDDERLFAAIRAGAQGYLLKNIPVAKLLAALRGLIERGEAAITGDPGHIAFGWAHQPGTRNSAVSCIRRHQPGDRPPVGDLRKHGQKPCP
jgi:DNA-binding NarL/FixJ family response regulator